MGFLEKVKNMFTEEVEDDDVKVEQIKKEVTHVAIESPNVKEEKDKYQEAIISEIKESKPIFFDDKDFSDEDYEPRFKIEKEEIKEKDLYGSKIKSEKPVEDKKIFKPTPIISPVYGVLDKNYHKEDIVSRNDIIEEKTVQESPIDTIRNKAYGTLEDELEDTLFGANSILFKREDEINEEPKEKEKSKEKVNVKEVDSGILDDLTDDIGKKLDELLEKYTDDEDEKEKKVDDEDLLGFIDSTLYKNGDE